MSFVCVFCRLRARGALEDRLEELGVDPMRTKITEEELETARALLAEERARKVSLFRTEFLFYLSQSSHSTHKTDRLRESLSFILPRLADLQGRQKSVFQVARMQKMIC